MIDAATLWKSAKQTVSNTVEKVQSNLSQALADLDGDTEGLERELESFKEQLVEAQMQHVELSKQMRLIVAEKDAEIAVLKKLGGNEQRADTDAEADVVIAAQVEIEKARSECAAMGKNMLELSEKLRASLSENNTNKAMKSKMESMQARYNEMSKDYAAIKKESKKQLIQKSETIDNLVAEYSNLASESELKGGQDELRVSEVVRENEILATKLHVMELNIAELADRSVGSDGAGGSVNVSKVDAARIEELSKLRSKVLGLELDLKEAQRRSSLGGGVSLGAGGDGRTSPRTASAVAEAVETTSAAAAQVASQQIQTAVNAATAQLKSEVQAAHEERQAYESKTRRLTSELEEARRGAAASAAAASGGEREKEQASRILELESAVHAAGKEKEEVEARLDEVTADAEAIRATLLSLQEAEEQQRGALESMSSQYAALQAHKSEGEERTAALQVDRDRLQTDVSIKTKALEGYVAILKGKDEELDGLKGSVEPLQKDIASAREALGEAERKVQALTAQYSEAQEQCDKAREELHNVETRYDAITEQRVREVRGECEQMQIAAVAAMAAQRDKYADLYNKENLQRKKIHNRLLELQGNIRVLCRVRPVLALERKHAESDCVCEVPTRQDLVVTRDELSKTKFEYDHVFAPTCGQQDVFASVKPLCVSVLDGYNVCIFAYGQTGSGKTFTMEGDYHNPSTMTTMTTSGSGSGVGEGAGVAPRAIYELFRVSKGETAETVNEEEGVMKPAAKAQAQVQVQLQAPHAWIYSFRFSMLEIYNETIRDLLSDSSSNSSSSSGGSRGGSRTSSRASSPTPSSTSSGPSSTSGDGGTGKATKDTLDIRMTREGGTVVVGLTEFEVTSPEQVMSLLQQGQANRAVGSHDMNEHSSRSHSILTLKVTGKNTLQNTSTSGKLHLIDLAGSERVGKTDATGDRLKEAQNINRSLSALGDVIAALGSRNSNGSGSNKGPSHVPFRNSKLTYLLQDSLGGNSKVCMIVNVSPVARNVGETVCSLTFASRCRAVELGNAKRNVGKAS